MKVEVRKEKKQVKQTGSEGRNLILVARSSSCEGLEMRREHGMFRELRIE